LGEAERDHDRCPSSSQRTWPSQGFDRGRPPKTFGIDEGPLGCETESRRRRADNESARKKEARSYCGWPSQAFGVDEGSLGCAPESGGQEVTNVTVDFASTRAAFG
jgi:hypothetical protein